MHLSEKPKSGIGNMMFISCSISVISEDTENGKRQV